VTLSYEDFKQSVYATTLSESEEIETLEEGAETSFSDNDLDSAIKRTIIAFTKQLDNLKLAKTLNDYLTEKLKRAK
jgi:hypothetical protein